MVQEEHVRKPQQAAGTNPPILSPLAGVAAAAAASRMTPTFAMYISQSRSSTCATTLNAADSPVGDHTDRYAEAVLPV